MTTDYLAQLAQAATAAPAAASGERKTQADPPLQTTSEASPLQATLDRFYERERLENEEQKARDALARHEVMMRGQIATIQAQTRSGWFRLGLHASLAFASGWAVGTLFGAKKGRVPA